MADSGKAAGGGIRFSTPAGEWVVQITGMKNIILFERQFNVSAQVLQMSPRLEYLAFMAWTAARSEGLPVADDFDKFIDELVDIESVEGEGPSDANPTAGGS